VVDLRIYRASFVIGLVALLVMMFSLQERPRPLGATLAPDAFEGTAAYSETARLLDRYPDREPGSAGDASVGKLVESRFRSLGFETSREGFNGDFDGNDVRMSNVLGLLNAPSDRQIVVMAPRDAGARPGASSASSTAVLLELAGALDASSRKKTFVFVSTDGSVADSAGAQRFVDTYPDKDKVDAVLVLDDPGAAEVRRPFLVPWSTGSGRGSLQMLRTADGALAREADVRTGSESWPAQFLRQAWPLTLREQGPLVAGGLDAVTLTAHGEVPRNGARDTLERVSELRLSLFGRAAFASVLAFDGPRALDTSPKRYVVAGHKVIPDWAISLLAVGLVLPALIASVDGFARSRRRALPIGRRMRWVLAAAPPFALTLAAAFVFQIAGWLPDSASSALAPATKPAAGESAPALAALGLLFALCWFLVRPAVAGRAARLAGYGGGRPAMPDPATTTAVALLVSIELLLVCAFNPFTALLLAPVAHLCVLAALPQAPRRSLLGGATLAVALLLPVIAIAYYGARLDLGLDPLSYALMMIGAISGSPWTALLFSLVAGTLTSALLVDFTRFATREADSAITVRGPVTYAGPGSLGGTESALRR
jgi:Peptidase family M28